MSKQDIKIKILTEKLEKESGKKVSLVESHSFEENRERYFDSLNAYHNDREVNWTLDQFKEWCKRWELEKQAPGKELWGVQIDKQEYKEYYVQDSNQEYAIVFKLYPDGKSTLFIGGF